MAGAGIGECTIQNPQRLYAEHRTENLVKI
jgi:hypothetical protein